MCICECCTVFRGRPLAPGTQKNSTARIRDGVFRRLGRESYLRVCSGFLVILSYSVPIAVAYAKSANVPRIQGVSGQQQPWYTVGRWFVAQWSTCVGFLDESCLARLYGVVSCWTSCGSLLKNSKIRWNERNVRLENFLSEASIWMFGILWWPESTSKFC